MYRALLVCNSRFPESAGELAELHGPKKDGILLRDALTDHDTGMFNRSDVHLVSEGSTAEITNEIETFFSSAEPDDALLFYYSGHGKVLNQEFFLAASDTNVKVLYSTAIPKSTLDGIVNGSFAQVKILILDCCNSGLAKGSGFAEKLSGRGRFVITATSASEHADDSKMRGLPSPFTEHLAKALLTEAIDRDGDGNVDLDDVYHYIENSRFGGPRPERNFDGAGTIAIARRLVTSGQASAGEVAQVLVQPSDNVISATSDGTYPAQPYLEARIPGATFNADRVAEFRTLLRDDKLESMPRQLPSREFLYRAGVLKGKELTYTGILMFGDNPTQFLPTAMVQCVRFSGTAKTDPLQSTELQGTVPEMIVGARDFVAQASRLGETASAEGAYAEPTYKFPMIAVREIIANAIVHRSYEEQESCVQIHLYSDRIEVISPGVWGGSPAVEEGEKPLGQLERQSRRLNFRLAQLLTWSKLVEGVGTGVPRAVADCRAVGAPEPTVITDNHTVTVIIYPRVIKPSPADLAGVPMPTYHSMARDLQERIEEGKLKPGDQLPTENDLRDQYGMSRNTIRDAIKWLVGQGLVETRPGQGTFVTEEIRPFIVTLGPYTTLITTPSDLAAHQRVPSTSSLHIEIREAHGDVAAGLELEEGTTVVSRHQLRYIDEWPWLIQTVFYPMRLVEQGASRLLQTTDISEGVVRYLETALSIRETGYRYRIIGRPANEIEANFFRLGDNARTSVSEIFETGVDQEGKPIRLTVNVSLFDRNQFVIDASQCAQ